jgi:hypothetical protein
MKKFRVVLPMEIAGKVYEFGAVIELEPEVAKAYAHALIAQEEK